MNRHLLFNLLVFLIIVFVTGSCSKNNSTTKPTASFVVLPNTGNLGTTFTFDTSKSYDNTGGNTNMQYRWDYENNGVWDTQWSDSAKLSHRFQQTGYYTVGMEIKDRFGLTDWVSRNLMVTEGNSGSGNSPVASFSISPIRDL